MVVAFNRSSYVHLIKCESGAFNEEFSQVVNTSLVAKNQLTFIPSCIADNRVDADPNLFNAMILM